jgi:hypothetical protein
MSAISPVDSKLEAKIIQWFVHPKCHLFDAIKVGYCDKYQCFAFPSSSKIQETRRFELTNLFVVSGFVKRYRSILQL